MFKHNLLLICRTIKRQRSSFIINLIGLSSGLACTLLIYLWIQDELNMDRYHQKDSQLYQVLRNSSSSEGIETEEYTPGLLAQTIKEEVPEVEHAIAVVPPISAYEGVLSSGDSHIKATTQFADKEYFNAFSLNFSQGNKHLTLTDKNAVSISEAMALKLFGTTEDVVGKTVEFKNQYFNGLYNVAGIFSSPANSSKQFDILFSYSLFLNKRPEIREWKNGGPSTFLVVKKGTDIEQLNKKITAVIQSKRTGSTESLFLQRFSERYLYGKYDNGQVQGGRIAYIHLFSITALFILAIACINFINLSTAKASVRMKEVGIKKTIGAGRRTLIIQYLGESLFIVFISLTVAVLITALLLPQFNSITAKNLHLSLDGGLILSLLAIGVLTGLAAGSYPAFYISGFNPVAVLKGKLKASMGELLIRKGLVIFQFAASVILIVAVIVVYKQLQYIQNKNLGYDKSNVISFVREGIIEENFPAFISAVKNIPGVEHASYMFGDLTGGASSRSGGLSWEGQGAKEKEASFGYLDVDYELIETLGLQLKEGRSFSQSFGSDKSSIIFNETAIKLMGIKNPIGKQVNFYGKRQIIGVVKDFHFESIHQKVKPFFIKLDSESGGNILVKIKAGAERPTIERISAVYKQFNPGFPFGYTFLDENYQAQYVAEQRVEVLSKYFAALAILISCLGLLGLAAFTAERRHKEIGIRKVIGADVSQIVRLLSGEFMKTVSLGIIIALPISFLIVEHWLKGYAYRIDLQAWYFIAAGLGALTIASITVASQAFLAASINPIKSLRTE